MAELISREWLQKEFNTRYFDTYGDKETVFMTINEAPAIKEQSVGHWIFKHDPITDPKGYFIRIVCSECNLHTGQRSNFCPQCGARMEARL